MVNIDMNLKLLGIRNKKLLELLTAYFELKENYIDFKNLEIDLLTYNVKRELNLDSWTQADELSRTLKLLIEDITKKEE